MQWTTPISIPRSEFKINYQNKMVLMGSCFSDEIGNKLQKLRFPVVVNPLGTIFNPVVLFNQIRKRNENLNPKHFLATKDLCNHYDFHSSIWGYNQEELINNIKHKQEILNKGLQNCKTLILTLGTAYVHELKSSKKTVSNCHKQPQNLFDKKLLSITEIVESYKKMALKLEPTTNIILTISPVRHTREGIAENQLSKSILRVACAEIANLSENINYFPSYEIMIDELRDYRFYKSDMIHPTEQAVNYIFETFVNTYWDKPSQKMIEKIKNILQDLNHRSLTPNSEAHQKFLTKLLFKLETLNNNLNFETEISSLKKQLICS